MLRGNVPRLSMWLSNLEANGRRTLMVPVMEIQEPDDGDGHNDVALPGADCPEEQPSAEGAPQHQAQGSTLAVVPLPTAGATVVQRPLFSLLYSGHPANPSSACLPF